MLLFARGYFRRRRTWPCSDARAPLPIPPHRRAQSQEGAHKGATALQGDEEEPSRIHGKIGRSTSASKLPLSTMGRLWFAVWPSWAGYDQIELHPRCFFSSDATTAHPRGRGTWSVGSLHKVFFFSSREYVWQLWLFRWNPKAYNVNHVPKWSVTQCGGARYLPRALLVETL